MSPYLINPGELLLRPSCADTQGVYLAEEGQRVEVCFTLPQVDRLRELQEVNFVTKNKSRLGKYVCHM